MLLDDLKTKHTTYIKRVKDAVRDKVRALGGLSCPCAHYCHVMHDFMYTCDCSRRGGDEK
jgi:hypothetical protein